MKGRRRKRLVGQYGNGTSKPTGNTDVVVRGERIGKRGIRRPSRIPPQRMVDELQVRMGFLPRGENRGDASN